MCYIFAMILAVSLFYGSDFMEIEVLANEIKINMFAQRQTAGMAKKRKFWLVQYLKVQRRTQ